MLIEKRWISSHSDIIFGLVFNKWLGNWKRTSAVESFNHPHYCDICLHQILFRSLKFLRCFFRFASKHCAVWTMVTTQFKILSRVLSVKVKGSSAWLLTGCPRKLKGRWHLPQICTNNLLYCFLWFLDWVMRNNPDKVLLFCWNIICFLSLSRRAETSQPISKISVSARALEPESIDVLAMVCVCSFLRWMI